MKYFYQIFLLIIFTLPISSIGSESFKSKMYKSPIREVSIIITDDGFYPNRIVAFEGDKIRFFVTSTTSEKECFVMKKHKIFLAAQKGKVNEGEVNLEQLGRFKFFCPSSKHFGYLNVLERPEKVQKSNKRVIASEKPGYWTPRDYDEM